MSLIIIAVILRITANSTLNSLQKQLTKKFLPADTNFKTYLILTIICFPLFLILYFKNCTMELIIWALSGGIFGALGNAFLIASLKYGELSILGPINSYKTIVGLFFGIIILKEMPNFQAIIGIIVIIYGSFYVFKAREQKGFSFSILKNKDIFYRFIALFFSAIEAIFIKKVILLSDIYCSFLLWAIFGFVFSFVILKVNNKKAFENNFNIYPFIPLAICIFVMQFSTNFVFQKMPVAQGLSLFQLSNIVNIFIGCKLFNEKHLLKKLTGSIIMIAGSIIILFS